MRTKLGSSVKSFYEVKAEEFIQKKQSLKGPSSSADPIAKVKPNTPVLESSELAKDLQECAEISPKMFGLILDDHAIGHTNLEGVLNCSTTIDYMANILAKNKARFASLGLDADRFIKQFAFPSAVIHDIETLFDGKRNLIGKEKEALLKELQKIAENVAESVKNLKVGERLLLSGGWTGHAILYEVIKDSNNSYRFAVYNTGDGLEHHPAIFHDLKIKSQGYIEIEGISLKKITSPSFYKTLFEINYLNRIDSSEESKIKGPDELHLGVLTSLGGTRKISNTGHLGYRSTQRSGTCAWKCLMEALRQSCSSYQQYRRLKYLVQCQTLFDFSKTLEKMDIPGLPIKERQSLEHLLKTTSQKIGRSLTKSFDKGWISHKELEEGLRLTEKLKIPVIDSPPSKIIETENSAKTTVIQHYEGLYLTTQFNSSLLSKKGIKADISKGMPDVPELDFTDSKKLDEQIDRYYQEVTTNGNSTLRGLEILTSSIMKLPIPKKGVKDLWDSLSENEINKKTEQLCRLVRLISCMTTTANQGCDPKTLLSTLLLVAILDKLARRSKDSKLPNAPVYAGLLKSFNSVGFILPTKELQDLRLAIEDYFNASDEAPEKRLFSFTAYNWFLFTIITPYAMLSDFAKGAIPSELHTGYYLDKNYIDTCLSDPAILGKLIQKGIYEKRAQIQALLEDFTEYMPAVDGRLKEAVLLSRLMQDKLRPTFDDIYTDSNTPSLSFPSPDLQLNNLLPNTKRDFHDGKYYPGSHRFENTSPCDRWAKYIKTAVAPKADIFVISKDISNHPDIMNEFKPNTYYTPGETPDKSPLISLWEDSDAPSIAPPLAQELSHIKIGNTSWYNEVLMTKTELSNEVVLQNHRKNTKLSLEETLHIRLAGVDEKDAPWRLVSFLEEHFNDFQDPGVQILLISYLYHPSVTKIMQEQPLFIEKLKNQTLRAYDLYKQDEDSETAAFMMHYLKRMEGRYEELFGNTTPFNDIAYKDKLIALRPLAKTNSQKSSIDIAIGLLHYQGACLNKPFTEEVGYDTLRATFALQNHPVENDRHHLLYRQELRYLQTKYRHEIANYLGKQTPANRDKILNACIGESAAERHWEGAYPDYKSQSIELPHEHHYNVVRGELTRDGFINKVARPIPEKTLVEYGLPATTMMDEDRFYYSPDKKKRLSLGERSAPNLSSLSTSPKPTVVCEYQINGQWRRWQALSDSLLQSLGLLNVDGCYIHSGNTLFLADKQRNPLYEANYSNRASKQFITKVIKTIDNKPYNLVDPNSAKNDSGFKLLNFLGNNRLSLWKRTGDDNHLLEIDNGLFAFEKRDHHYYSLQYEGYCLATPKETPLSGLKEYIHLIHKTSGREKIIILSPKESSPEQMEAANFFPPLTFENQPQVFNLDKDGLPIIKTSKDCIGLSYIALIMRDYEKAAHYLSRAEEMGKSDDTSIESLKKILSLSDNHPDAINCRMQVLCLLKKNDILHGEKRELEGKEQAADGLFKEQLEKNLYLDYLTTAGKGKLPIIPIFMEKSLWRNLSEKFLNEEIKEKHPLLEKRRQQILHGKNSELAAPVYLQKNTLSFDKDIEQKTFSNFFDFYPPSSYPLLDPIQRQEKEEQLILDRKLLPFLGAGKGFRTHFIDFYQDAKNSSKELAARLAVMRGETDEGNRYLASVLEKVMASGGSFPKVPVFSGDYHQMNNTLDDWISKVKAATRPGLLQTIFDIAKWALQLITSFINSLIDSKTTLWANFRAKVSSSITFVKGHNISNFVKDLKKEISGKSNTSMHHAAPILPPQVMSLPLTKEVLFTESIKKVDKALVKSLEQKIDITQKNMQALEKEALKLAERLPQDSNVASLIQMKRLSGDESALTMQELMGLFIIGLQGPYLENTYLTQEGVAQLELAVGQYLQQKILNDHAKACLELHGEYGKAKGLDKKYLETKLLALANEQPQYEPKDHREYLVFEGMTGIRLRVNQTKKLDLLSAADRLSVVIHMIMGDGKSTVITPVQALLLARQGFLPLIVVPDSLHQTGKETTKSTVFKSFGKLAHPFEIQRDSDFSKEKLLMLTDSLKHWKEEKGFIYTTRESLLSFLLKSKELFYQYEETQGVEAKQELKETVELAWGILRELKQSGAALLDEAHSLLNCRDELNFTFGHPNHIDRREAEGVYDILKFLVQDPQMKKLVDLKNNNQAKMSSETYVNTVKPILVERLSKRFDVPKEYFNDATDTVPSVVSNHPEKDLIALGKVVVSTFLPHTLTKKRDEHYGLGSTSKYCIPYIGNNTPNEKAEFASYLETLLYTGYYYVQQELTSEQLIQFRVDSLAICRQEQSASKLLVLETKANALFKKITGQDLTSTFDDAQAKAYIKAHPEVIFDYCVEKVLPEISIYPSKLSANPHHLAALFKQVDCMTGTPWNKDAYPSQFKTAEEKEIDDKSIGIIQKIKGTDLITLHGTQDDEVFQNIIEAFREQPDCRAVIDAGALIKTVSNEGVAKALLAASDPEEIDGIAYYDEENELRVLERATMESVIFKDSVIPKERRVTFYDQRHTLGSDITQQRDAKALVTLSETIKKFELFQAIWRMREIDKGQTLTFLIPASIKPLIAKDTPITPQKILDFVTHNQKEQELFDNFRSRKLEIKAIVEEAIHDALMDAPNFAARLEIFKKTSDLLMMPLDIKPFEAFGGIDKDEDAITILQRHTKKWVDILDDLEKKKALKDASKYKKKIEMLKAVPLNPKYRETENTSIDTQIENQVEMQVKLTVATKPDEYREGIRPWTVWKWSESLNIFKDNWMKIASFWSYGVMPMYRAQDLLGKARNPKVASMKGVFNNTFLVSNNFLPQKVKGWREIHAQPFAWYAKPVYHLVVTEEANGDIKTLMIDQNDLSFFREKLIKDHGDYARKICIYDPTLGITLQGKKAFDEKTLKANEKFVKHLVYAKFWNGISKYTEDEVKFLETWIQSQGIDKMYEFFKEIVRNKPDSAKAFANSTLAGVFEKLHEAQKK